MYVYMYIFMTVTVTVTVSVSVTVTVTVTVPQIRDLLRVSYFDAQGCIISKWRWNKRNVPDIHIPEQHGGKNTSPASGPISTKEK
jgi:hypothetical protein